MMRYRQSSRHKTPVGEWGMQRYRYQRLGELKRISWGPNISTAKNKKTTTSTANFSRGGGNFNVRTENVRTEGGGRSVV